MKIQKQNINLSFISDTADITSMIIGREDLVGEYDFLNKGFRKAVRGISTLVSDDENVHEQVEWLADGIYKLVEVRKNIKKKFTHAPRLVKFENLRLDKYYSKTEKILDEIDLIKSVIDFVDHFRSE